MKTEGIGVASGLVGAGLALVSLVVALGVDAQLVRDKRDRDALRSDVQDLNARLAIIRQENVIQNQTIGVVLDTLSVLVERQKPAATTQGGRGL